MSTYMYGDQMAQLYTAGTQQRTYYPPRVPLKYYEADAPGVSGGWLSPMSKPPLLSKSQIGGCGNCPAGQALASMMRRQYGGAKVHRPIVVARDY